MSDAGQEENKVSEEPAKEDDGSAEPIKEEEGEGGQEKKDEEEKTEEVAAQPHGGDAESGDSDEETDLGGFPDDDEDAEKNKVKIVKNDITPLIRFIDIPDNTRGDIIETITFGVETLGGHPESACMHIKDTLDRVYGPYWHVVIGEAFAYEVTYHLKHIIYLFMDNLGILVWKCC